LIRVNLLRNRIGTTSGETQVIDTGSSASVQGSRDSLVKIAMIVLFTAGLMLYESSTVSKLNKQSADVQAQLAQVQTEATAKAAQVEAIKDIESQAKELQDKLKMLKLLSKLRLREVKTLDFMQSSIPERVWLTSLNYEADKEKLEEGRLSFAGSTLATEDLTEFVKRLENSAYLTQVIVVKNQEVASSSGKSGNVREFLFTAEVESKQ